MGVNAPAGIAVDGVNVYFTSDTGAGAVLLVPLAGGTPSTFAAGQGYPNTIALDPQNAYWVDYSTTGAVFQAGK